MAHGRSKKSLTHEVTNGNRKEDWEVFDILCMQNSEMDEDSHDAMTALKSELAALQYKRDKLMSELNEMRAQVRSRDQRTVELQSETETLKEQAARQNAIIASLKKRIQELEEKERNLSLAQGRSETALETLQRENKYQEEKNKELGRKIRALEVECHAEEQSKLAARESMSDFLRKLSNALGVMETIDSHASQECLAHKAADLVLETSRLRSRTSSLGDNLHAVEVELKSCREALERAVGERDNFQRQAASHFIEIDKLKKEKEDLEIQQKVAERELCELREKLAFATKNLGCASVNSAAQEVTISQLRDECRIKEEKSHRLQSELRLFLESLAIALSTPTRFVGSTEDEIKNGIKAIVQESKEKALQIETLKENVNYLNGQMAKKTEMDDESNHRMRILQEEKCLLETRLSKLEEDLHNSNVARESLRTDKATFLSFIERLNRIFNMDEIAKEVEPDLMIESLLVRAEKLARLESNKIVDKFRRRETRKFCIVQYKSNEFELSDESNVPNAKETENSEGTTPKERPSFGPAEEKTRHSGIEENFRARSTIAVERDEATMKCKKLMKQVEKLESQLADGRSLSQDIKNQLAEAGDFKIAALERGRKVEELQKRLVDAETVISRYNKKISTLKEELRNTGQNADQERTISEHSLQLLRDDLTNTKLSLAECTRRENQLHGFKSSVCKALCLPPGATDFDLLTKLEKLVAAHREFTLLSRRYEDPITGTSFTPVRTPKYEDSGFLDQHDLSPLEDSDDISHSKHAH
ncbi:hypothetical protein RUM44_012178 [Polyplax serrata]|uniref:Coiled-coil domain-containing protein 170 n=1 Tax=Polyplax serrata TaxID=468196 RepID=A0ABR1BAJ6_POLSC